MIDNFFQLNERNNFYFKDFSLKLIFISLEGVNTPCAMHAYLRMINSQLIVPGTHICVLEMLELKEAFSECIYSIYTLQSLLFYHISSP